MLIGSFSVTDNWWGRVGGGGVGGGARVQGNFMNPMLCPKRIARIMGNVSVRSAKKTQIKQTDSHLEEKINKKTGPETSSLSPPPPLPPPPPPKKIKWSVLYIFFLFRDQMRWEQ